MLNAASEIAAEEAGRVNRHEGIKPTAHCQRGGRDNPQNTEKTSQKKGIRQQMDLALECVESFKN